jgi:hypothetical protein
MILTSMTLGAVAVLAGGSQLVRHRKDIPHFPIVIGLGLTILIPSAIILLVIEWMALCSWNPLIWME